MNREAEKLRIDAEHLRRLLDDESAESIELALGIVKRVRRTATILTKQLASQRDELLQNQEVHKQNEH